jgi:hypothetical protein
MRVGYMTRVIADPVLRQTGEPTWALCDVTPVVEQERE